MGDALVGVDGGGTHTRVLVTGADGRYLAYAEDDGCNPEYEPVEACLAHAKGALTRALAQAGVAANQVRAFVAGIAGVTSPGDGGQWARRLASDLGFSGQVSLTGDGTVAQCGAFGGAPGIVALGGTGSIVFATTETGREVSTADLGYYSGASAWALAHGTIMRLAAGEDGPEDAGFVSPTLSAVGCPDASNLRERLLDHGSGRLHISGVAPLVTAWAERGAPLARAVCDDIADELARGVRLLTPFFQAHPVPVAPIGSVASSPYMRTALAERVAQAGGRLRFALPLYPPVVGAALMAARLADHHLSAEAAHSLAVRVSDERR